jgi:hypothetical protein
MQTQLDREELRLNKNDFTGQRRLHEAGRAAFFLFIS